MERPLKADDLVLRLGAVRVRLFGELADELEGSLVSFRARVGEKDFGRGVGGGGGGRGETETAVGLGEVNEKGSAGTGPRVVVDVGGVDKEFGLVVKELGDLRREKGRAWRRRLARSESIGLLVRVRSVLYQPDWTDGRGVDS
jgi:hypothetical protein